MQYLSDEWIEAAGAALEVAPPLDSDPSDATTSIQYEVTAAPGGKVKYALVLEAGRIRIEPGTFADASVSFALDYTTAADIAQGNLSAQAAFMQGRLKLGGNVTVLVEQRGILDGAADVLGELRTVTTF